MLETKVLEDQLIFGYHETRTGALVEDEFARNRGVVKGLAEDHDPVMAHGELEVLHTFHTQ